MTQREVENITVLDTLSVINATFIGPTNTVGTMLAGNGTALVPFAVGADGTALLASSSSPLGVTYGTPSAAASTTTPITGSGSTASPITVTAGTTFGQILQYNPGVTGATGWAIVKTPSIPVVTVGTTGAMYSTLAQAAAAMGSTNLSVKIITNLTEANLPGVTNIYIYIDQGLTLTLTALSSGGNTIYITGPASNGRSTGLSNLTVTIAPFGGFFQQNYIGIENLTVTASAAAAIGLITGSSGQGTYFNNVTWIFGNNARFGSANYLFMTNCIFAQINTASTLFMQSSDATFLSNIEFYSISVGVTIASSSSEVKIVNLNDTNLGAVTIQSNFGEFQISNSRFFTMNCIAGSANNQTQITNCVMDTISLGLNCSNFQFSNCYVTTVTDSGAIRATFTNCRFRNTVTLNASNQTNIFNGCMFGQTTGGAITLTGAAIATARLRPLVTGCFSEAALVTVNAASTGNATI